MLPLFFGNSHERLYGVYQEPAGQIVSGTGVLLCYPLGQEYMRVHLAFRRLSVLLAKAGMHTFRFDYFGTGDSAGNSEDITMDTCLGSVVAAAEELRAMAGITQLILLGLRFGGLIAVLANDASIKAGKIVLWDPVVEGRTYVEEIRQMHQKVISHPFYIQSGPRFEEETADFEVLTGHRFRTNFLDELSKQSLIEPGIWNVGQVHLYTSIEKPDFFHLRDLLLNTNSLSVYRVCDDEGDWTDVGKFDTALMATKIISEICNNTFSGSRRG